MFIENHIPNKRKGEKLILFLRRHWIVIIGHWLFYVFLALIPIGLYYFIGLTYATLLTNTLTFTFLFLLASLYYLYILLFFYHAFIDFHLDVWIVTNKRIINIEQQGLFNREISEHEVEKIQDVTGTQKGFLQTIFSYGDVHVQTAGEIQRFIFKQVNDPFEVVKIINHLLKDIRIEAEKRGIKLPQSPTPPPPPPTHILENNK